MPLVKLPGFDEATRRHSWDGNRLPVLYEGDRGCPHCSIGYLVRLTPHVQPALFYHGGYGAAERLTYDLCVVCGRVSVAQVESLNPRRL